MGSVDRSGHKRGLHKIPSRLTAGSTGRPRAAMDAGETKGWKYLNRQTCRTRPSGSPEWQARAPRCGEGATQPETEEISQARSTDGAVHAASRGNRPGPVEGRSTAKEERRLASHPNRRRRGARAENSGCGVHKRVPSRGGWRRLVRCRPDVACQQSASAGGKSKRGLASGQIERIRPRSNGNGCDHESLRLICDPCLDASTQ